jgi:hypothetical protein
VVSWIAVDGNEIRGVLLAGTPPAVTSTSTTALTIDQATSANRFSAISARNVQGDGARLLVGQAGVLPDGQGDANRGVFLFTGNDGEWAPFNPVQSLVQFRSAPVAVDLRVSSNGPMLVAAGAPADDACLPNAGGVVFGTGGTESVNFRDVMNSGAIEQDAGLGHTVSIGNGIIAVTANQGPATVFRLLIGEIVAVAIIDGDIGAAIVIDDTTVVTADRATPSNIGIVTIP